LGPRDIDAILDGFEPVPQASARPGTPVRLQPLQGSDPRRARRAQAVPPDLRALLDAEVLAGRLHAAFVVEEGNAAAGWRLTVALYLPPLDEEATARRVAELGRRIADTLAPETAVDLRPIDGSSVDFYAALDPKGPRLER
jgi:hypothetical protein